MTANLLDEVKRALEALLELVNHANAGAFSNGVTDSTGSIDEGDVIASRIISDARSALAALEAELAKPGMMLSLALNAPRGIYTASKTHHAPLWQQFRADGYPIISTWIDEAGPGETQDHHDLWTRCIRESQMCEAMVVYREPDDVLKGAWLEMGAALAAGVPVFAVGCEDFTIGKSGLLTLCDTVDEAMAKARALTSEPTP